MAPSERSTSGALVKSSAGPPSAITGQRISVTSRIDTRLHRDDVIFGRGRSMNVQRSGNGTLPLCALEGLVGAAAVDRWHFRTHRSEVGHQLAAVMDAMVVGQPQKRD